jgi:hypothetical protein
LEVLTALFLTCSGLLVYAGAVKLREPEPTGEALRLAGMPDSRHLVRALGTGEVALGSAAIVLGGAPVATLVGLVYLSFAVFAARQRASGADCGCLGQPAPVTRLHVVVNVSAALTAAVAVVRPVPGIATTSGDLVTAGLLLVVLGVAVALLRIALTTLPALADAIALHRPETDT